MLFTTITPYYMKQTAKIIKQENVGLIKTIDLEVDHPDHNFYCNDIVVSNSHAVAYSTLSAWTTYLKFNHPKEFFLSLLKMTKFEPTPQAEV